MSTSPSFDTLGLHPKLLEAVARLGYEEPTAIQEEAIPALIAGSDLLGLAATGTGKTAAFALPLLQRLVEGEGTGTPRAIVLVPTRELCTQVAEAVHQYGRGLGLTVLPVYGGAPMHVQIRALERGVDVVVATPGRALDHLGRGTLTLADVVFAVLDEADEMLDMGFQEEIEALLAELPTERQTALFSATFPRRLAKIADTVLREPVRVEVRAEEAGEGEVPRIRQVAYVVGRAYKLAALARVLDIEDPDTALVFCRTRLEVDELVDTLGSRGYRAEALHGGLSQSQRDRVMQRLRSGNCDLVVATDVAARGIDVEHLSHVINYDVPSAPSHYVHRIGRTGRAGREGVAITLVEPRERRSLQRIEQVTKQPLPVEPLPTLDDLRARRVDLLRDRVREIVAEGELGRFRVVAARLAEEIDVLDVAAAALAALHDEAGGDPEDEHIPAPHDRRERPSRGDRSDRGARPDRGPRTDHRPEPSGNWALLQINQGRATGVRARDVFGALLGETGLQKSEVGAIRVSERSSFVEVPPDKADHVIESMNRASLRGRPIAIRYAPGR